MAVLFEEASKQLSADTVVVGDEDRGRHVRPWILAVRSGAVNLGPPVWKGRRHRVGSRYWRADMTELQSPLDMAVLSELRESVGDDPEFLAELIDDFMRTPRPSSHRCARPQPRGMRSAHGVRRTL